MFLNIFVCIEKLNYMEDFMKVKITKLAKITKGTDYLSEIFLETFKVKLSFQSTCRVFFIKIEGQNYVFKLNIFFENLKGIFYEQFFHVRHCRLQNQNRNPHHRQFFVSIIPSPKIWRNGLWYSRILIETELSSVTQNFSKLSQMLSWGCFEIATPKNLKNIQKNVCNRVSF